jgi:hypothetical protein
MRIFQQIGLHDPPGPLTGHEKEMAVRFFIVLSRCS